MTWSTFLCNFTHLFKPKLALRYTYRYMYTSKLQNLWCSQDTVLRENCHHDITDIYSPLQHLRDTHSTKPTAGIANPTHTQPPPLQRLQLLLWSCRYGTESAGSRRSCKNRQNETTEENVFLQNKSMRLQVGSFSHVLIGAIRQFNLVEFRLKL